MHEKKESIRNYSVQKIKNIENKVYNNKMLVYQNMNIRDFDNSNIYLGEDWYLVYEEREDNTIYISDLAKIKPNLIDEAGIQNKEIMDIIYSLVKKYDQVEADLKEDTSYLLFLANKKLGYLEQIGDDIQYPFNSFDEAKILSEDEQFSILKRAKEIKEKGNPNNIMHKITFKKGKKLENSDIKISNVKNIK